MPKRSRSSTPNTLEEETPFIQHQLRRLYQKQCLCDVRLVFRQDDVQDTLMAHKLILACYSDVFEAMFMSPGFRESTENEVLMKDVRPQTFRYVLDFMYVGPIALPEEELLEVMKVAEMYNIKPLLAHCLSLYTGVLTTKNCFDMLMGIEQVGVREALERTSAFITDHFLACLKLSAKAFLKLPLDLFVMIIARDELNATDEEVVFGCVVQWLRHGQNRRYANRVLPLVRYTSMKQDFIIHSILCDYSLLEEFPILSKLVNDALEWFKAQQLPVAVSAFKFRINRRKYHRVDTRKVRCIS